jgi:5'-nucleotidase
MTAWFVDRRARAVALLSMLAVLLLGAAGLPGAQAQPPARDGVAFWLTLLHNNDGESALLERDVPITDAEGNVVGVEQYGGVARFKTLVDRTRIDARAGASLPSRRGPRGVLMVSSGDNFLAGPEFSASLDAGVPFYDSVALDLVGYDAMTIGNHEFDFGPDVLAAFISGFRRSPPFLSANLDVSDEPALAALADAGVITASVVLRQGPERFGIVGATTPMLPFISSPRDVKVDPDVAGVVQTEVDALLARGIDKIILSSHLQSIDEDLELAGMLEGVDVMIAGGGDELLADDGTLLIPGDEGLVFGPYPLLAQGADGRAIPVVTTPGSYRYLGRLQVGFDHAGEVVTVGDTSGLLRVSAQGPDAVREDPQMLRRVTRPVEAALAGFAATVVGTSEVDLDGRRDTVRRVESNEGNLIADSLRWQATELAPAFGIPIPDVALQNGGGIRNDAILPAGPVTELDTFDMVPFANFVSVVPAVPRETFKVILENAVSRVELTDGRFAQVSGFSYTWDAARQPRVLDAVGNVVTDGERVLEVVLDSGEVIVSGGAVVPGPALEVATIDFLARGGDQYPFGDAAFTTLGVTYQQALRSYIEEGLGGVIGAADYPSGGEGRITRLN